MIDYNCYRVLGMVAAPPDCQVEFEHKGNELVEQVVMFQVLFDRFNGNTISVPVIYKDKRLQTVDVTEIYSLVIQGRMT